MGGINCAAGAPFRKLSFAFRESDMRETRLRSALHFVGCANGRGNRSPSGESEAAAGSAISAEPPAARAPGKRSLDSERGSSGRTTAIPLRPPPCIRRGLRWRPRLDLRGVPGVVPEPYQVAYKTRAALRTYLLASVRTYVRTYLLTHTAYKTRAVRRQTAPATPPGAHPWARLGQKPSVKGQPPR